MSTFTLIDLSPYFYIVTYQALSLVKQQKRELLHKDSVIRILKTQRDESVSILKFHGLTVPSQISGKFYTFIGHRW